MAVFALNCASHCITLRLSSTISKTKDKNRKFLLGSRVRSCCRCWFRTRRSGGKDRFKSDFSGLTNCLECLGACGREITKDADEQRKVTQNGCDRSVVIQSKGSNVYSLVELYSKNIRQSCFVSRMMIHISMRVVGQVEQRLS